MVFNIEIMRKAIALSEENVKNGGGPFAAIIVQNNEIISTGVNQVTSSNDPTAHAEINAIREAGKKIGTFDLSSCQLYTTCEPCPMCLGAIYWARIELVYYGNSRYDAKDIGFDDSHIYDEMSLDISLRKIKMEQHLSDESIVVFKQWQDKEDKIEY